MRPLEGIVVVALEQAVAAPFATCRMADAGARVIKVERAEGDFARGYDRVVNGQSSYFVWLNRGKESVTLDIKSRTDADRLEALIATADVFVQNLSPGAAERVGFGSESLRRRYPRLITCDIAGFGPGGPFSSRKAYDLLIQIESGLCSITGSPDQPARVGISLCDIATGQAAYAAILEALLLRKTTQRGSGLSLSLFDVMADLMAVPLLHYDFTGIVPGRGGLSHPTISPYGLFTTADTDIFIAVQNEREWVRFCEIVMQRDDLAKCAQFSSNPQRVSNRADLSALVTGVFESLDAAELESRLTAAGIAWTRMKSVADLSAHPHLRRFEVELPDGSIQMVAPPVCWSDRPPSSRPRLPKIGEHRLDT